MQNVLEKKPRLTDRGVATGVTKFRVVSGGLTATSGIFSLTFPNSYQKGDRNKDGEAGLREAFAQKQGSVW